MVQVSVPLNTLRWPGTTVLSAYNTPYTPLMSVVTLLTLLKMSTLRKIHYIVFGEYWVFVTLYYQKVYRNGICIVIMNNAYD